MNTRLLLLVIAFLVFSKQDLHSQFGFSHEIGVIAGPLAFYSDFGQRYDFKTNSGNSAIGIGLIHYINFSYRADCNCYTRDTYFNDHFKLRNEIDFYKLNLEHFGEWVSPDHTSPFADYLRAMTGSTTVFEIGSQLEYFPFSIRDFAAGSYKLAPFISLGVHWVSYDPEINIGRTDIDFNNDKYPPEAFQQEGGNTWAVVTSVGVRYKLTPLSDLMLDSRWEYYFSNWVDGLNPEVPENKANEWIYWINLGYIYYLE